MSGFLYWLPDGGMTVSLDELAAASVAYAFDGKATARTCDRGPDRNRGAVVVAGTNDDGKCGYYPDRQTWRQIPLQSVWVGMYRADPPAPADLARAEQVSGQWISDDRKQRWLAPIARKWYEMDDRIVWDHNLPRRLELADDGTWQPGSVKPRYERLWQLAMDYEGAANRALEAATEDTGTVRFRYDNMDELAVGAIQVNYRVGPAELAMLGVYDDQFRQRLIDVLLDNDTWQKWVQKKIAEQVNGGGDSSAGQPVESSTARP